MFSVAANLSEMRPPLQPHSQQLSEQSLCLPWFRMKYPAGKAGRDEPHGLPLQVIRTDAWPNNSYAAFLQNAIIVVSPVPGFHPGLVQRPVGTQNRSVIPILLLYPEVVEESIHRSFCAEGSHKPSVFSHPAASLPVSFKVRIDLVTMYQGWTGAMVRSTRPRSRMLQARRRPAHPGELSLHLEHASAYLHKSPKPR